MNRETVFLDYTQEELNAQYDQRTLVPNVPDYLQARTEDTDRAKEALTCRLKIPYGAHPGQLLDLYGTDQENAPLVVFIHGGAWTRGSKESAGYGAAAFVPHDIQYAALGFSQAPDVSIDVMVAQCREGVKYLYQHGDEYGYDPSRIHLIGHSSGAHLTAMMAVTDWREIFGLPGDIIKGVTTISGGYHLEPVMLSARNEYLHLDEEQAHRNTPSHFVDNVSAPVIIAWGGRELDEFKRQGQAWAGALEEAGKDVSIFTFKNNHHFEMAEEFCRQESPLFKAILDQVLGAKI